MFTRNGDVLIDAEAGTYLAKTIVAELKTSYELTSRHRPQKRPSGVGIAANDDQKRRRIPEAIRRKVSFEPESSSEGYLSQRTPREN